MSDKNQDLGVETLLGQIDAGLEVLGRIERHLASFFCLL